jgi:hypothetical protein
VKIRLSFARVTPLAVAVVVAVGTLTSGQQIQNEPQAQRGGSITPAFEGWYNNPDGSYSFLFGYMNRNQATAVDIPVGAENRIEPDGPDRGQPTHFLPGRQYGMFVVVVPKTFSKEQRLTWTISANKQPLSVPVHLHPDYEINPQGEVAVGNTPPVLKFEESGPPLQGPVAGLAPIPTRSAKVGTPFPLAAWVSDDGKLTTGSGFRPKGMVALRLTWSLFRGPANVTFDKASPEIPGAAQHSGSGAISAATTTQVTFSAPGEYELHVTANDYSGSGGQSAGGAGCCWTTGLIKASVTR